MGTSPVISGRNGEVRYFDRTVALLDTWTFYGVGRDPSIGTTAARVTFSPKNINRFWINFAAPTHVALPQWQAGRQGGPRRIYELIKCDLESGEALVRTPACAIEERR